MTDFLHAIIIGVITTLIASAVVFYLQAGGSSIRRAWSLAVSAWRLQKSGLGTIIPHRRDFPHLKTGPTIPDYISGAKFSFCYIGFWMAKSTEMEQITDALRKLLYRAVDVQIVMLSQNIPDSDIETISEILAISPKSCKSRIEHSWEFLLKFARDLPHDAQSRLTLRSHSKIISSSCFIIDEGRAGARLLVDMKIYGAGRESGIALEVYDNKNADSLYTRFLLSFNSIKEAKSTTPIRAVPAI